MYSRISQYLALLPILVFSEALAVDEKQASFDFGYAMQASGSCQQLFMRLDTEKKMEAKLGIKLRGPSAPHKDAYFDGLLKATGDEGKGLCENAWTWYGCSGTRHPRLLIENPFRNDSPQICPY